MGFMMTPTLIHKLTKAASFAGIAHRTISVTMHQIRILLAEENVQPIDAVFQLARERGRTHLRPDLPHLNPKCIHQALKEYERSPRENTYATEAIIQTLLSMDDEPTPAQLGELGRHFLISPPRAKWPALPCEFVAAVHRLQKQGKISEVKIETVIQFAEPLITVCDS